MSDNNDSFGKLTPEMLELLRQAADLKSNPIRPCLCGRMLRYSEYARKRYSGILKQSGEIAEAGVNYTDLLCADCRRQFDGYPRIVCLGCRELMGFMAPGRQATGFEFVRHRHYHIASCPRCSPQSHSTPVLEHERFCRVNGIPTKTNFDLLQDIEQKRLQVEKKVAIVRARLNAGNNDETNSKKYEEQGAGQEDHGT